MVRHNDTVSDVVKHCRGGDNMLSHSIINEDTIQWNEQKVHTPSFSDKVHCSFAASFSFPYVMKNN
jgi:hypothetical protein